MLGVVLDRETDSSGTVLERYAYSAYGVPTIANASGGVLSTSAQNNRYTYTGREWDNDIQQYHYRARAYNPHLGRFCSRDPIGYFASNGLHEFVNGNPARQTDPLGLFGIDVGGVINAFAKELLPDKIGLCLERKYHLQTTLPWMGFAWDKDNFLVKKFSNLIAGVIAKFTLDLSFEGQVCLESKCPSCARLGFSLKVEFPLNGFWSAIPGLTVKGFGQGGGKALICGPPKPLISEPEFFACIGMKAELKWNAYIAGLEGFIQVKGCCSSKNGCGVFVEGGGHYKVKGFFWDDKISFGGSKCIFGTCNNPWFG